MADWPGAALYIAISLRSMARRTLDGNSTGAGVFRASG
jgi:hypothetical protein